MRRFDLAATVKLHLRASFWGFSASKGRIAAPMLAARSRRDAMRRACERHARPALYPVYALAMMHVPPQVVYKVSSRCLYITFPNSEYPAPEAYLGPVLSSRFRHSFVRSILLVKLAAILWAQFFVLGALEINAHS